MSDFRARGSDKLLLRRPDEKPARPTKRNKRKAKKDIDRRKPGEDAGID